MKKRLYHSIQRLGLLAILVAFTSLNVLAEEGVILSLKNGQEVGFLFSSKPCIATADAELTITTSNGQTLSFDYDQIACIRFGETNATGISDVKQDDASDVTFRVTSGTLSVYNLPVGQSVSVYTLAGHRIAVQSQTTQGATLNILLQSNGVLVVRTSNGITYRLLNK